MKRTALTVRLTRRIRWRTAGIPAILLAFGAASGAPAQTGDLKYPIVDTNQTICWDAAGNVISPPAPGESCHGQDAQIDGLQPSYVVSPDGLSVLDEVTGLTWIKKPDLDGDGDLDVDDKLSWEAAQDYADVLNALAVGGWNDWRLPSIKELYSLADFSGYTGMSAEASKPYIDDSIFDFAYGDEAAGERFIDSQWVTTTRYVGLTMNAHAAGFGVNFADGRIKGYGLADPRTAEDKLFFVRCVRGNPDYGVNDFVENGDGTVTDLATGLMWTREDSGVGMNWRESLAWVESLNAVKHMGHDDWRLPNVKELQSIVDYARSPQTTGTPAIDPVFQVTAITDASGETNYPFYWSSTTHVEGPAGDHGCYVAFGEALGWMEQPPGSGSYVLLDVHGAGAQRSDPKAGDPDDYPYGMGPQGDVIRIDNFVRVVRDASAKGAGARATAWVLY